MGTRGDLSGSNAGISARKDECGEGRPRGTGKGCLEGCWQKRVNRGQPPLGLKGLWAPQLKSLP